jgi:osmotically-inducible protein OsmY
MSALEKRKKEDTMKTFFLLVPLLFGLNMFLIGCDEPNRPTGQTTTSSSASKMSDSDLEQAIRAKFDSDAQLKEAKLDVDADVDKNEVTLSGTVRSQEARSKAVELAKGAQPGLTVNDKIDVKPAA